MLILLGGADFHPTPRRKTFRSLLIYKALLLSLIFLYIISWDLAKFTHFSSEKFEVGKDELLKRLPWKLIGQALLQAGV